LNIAVIQREFNVRERLGAADTERPRRPIKGITDVFLASNGPGADSRSHAEKFAGPTGVSKSDFGVVPEKR